LYGQQLKRKSKRKEKGLQQYGKKEPKKKIQCASITKSNYLYNSISGYFVKFTKLIIFIFLMQPSITWAHSGGTNAQGCHKERSTRDYHCHNSRSEGAYQNQIEGYRKSRSKSPGILQFIFLGGVIFIVMSIITSKHKGDIKSSSIHENHRDYSLTNEKEKPPHYNLTKLPNWNSDLIFSQQPSGEFYLKEKKHIILMLSNSGSIIKHRTADLTKAYAGRKVGVKWLSDFYNYYSIHFMNK